MLVNVDAFHAFELECIRYLQLFRNPVLDTLMILLNYLDTIPFYLLFVASVWYLYDHTCGFALALLLVLSLVVNSDVKALFSVPRPFVLDPHVGLIQLRDYAFPSGAAQTTTALFGFVALTARKRWVWLACIGGVLVISLPRIYLGIHFPSDIIGGWVIGALLLGGFYWVLPSIKSLVAGQPTMTLVYLSVIGTLLAIFLCLNQKPILMVVFGFGVSVGYIVTLAEQNEGSAWQRVLRLGIALGGIVMMYQLSMLVQHSVASWQILSALAEAVSFFLAGLWLAFGPSLLTKKR